MGNNSINEHFFQLLFSDNEFCSELGRVSLASSKLESELIKLISKVGTEKNIELKTLGTLLNLGLKHEILDNNLYTVAKECNRQRNYLVHSIHALFIDLIKDEYKFKDNLIDSDVQKFTEIALDLQINLISLAIMIDKLNSEN